jgi:DNA-binding PadR family transcriptional regulator
MRNNVGGMGSDNATGVDVLGRYAGPATWILSSLADGPKHGYALINDIEDFADVRLQPGTLYAALTRLVEAGMIEPTGPQGRRQPYRLTPAGAEALREHLTVQRRIANVGLRRLSAGLVTP